MSNSAQIWATKLLEEVSSFISFGVSVRNEKNKGSYELSNSNEYGESIAMKFKFNITKTGLPDGDIIVGDWYEGIINTVLSPILNWNPLMTLTTSNGEKGPYIVSFFSTPDYGARVWRIFSMIFVFGYILSGTCKSI